MAFQVDVVTIFPDYFEKPLAESLLGKAQKKGLLKIRVHDLRDWTHDRRRTVDDKPFGGGPGMVMKPEPIFECVEAVRKKGWVVLLDPHGERLTQKIARRLAKKGRLVLIAGHYEGVDYRVHEHLADQEISIGDFITMGGEAPALCLIEAVARHIPGVLGNIESLASESFQSGILEYPQYTRPRRWRDMEVPEVLVSGNHEEVRRWREKISEHITHKKRPDLKRAAREESS